jgi:hypothetical protein
MNKQLLIIGILTLMISCKQSESKINNESEEKEIMGIKKNTTELNTIVESYIENDSLVNAMKSELENIALNPIFTIHKKPIHNKHVDNLIDTIIKRTLKKTEITSYKSADKEWVYKARIENEEFKLNDFILLGTKEYVIEKSLAYGIHSDTLKIGNLEQTSIFYLIFESEILKKIEYQGYID